MEEKENKTAAPAPEAENSVIDELAAEAAAAAEKEADAETAAPQESEVDKLKRELAELQEKYLYLQADYQNYRKRAARDISDARVNAVTDTLMPFLTIVDFLAMAGVAAEKSDNLEAIKQGLLMIIAQFDKALEELGVKKLDCNGEKFDPAIHEAVSHEPSDSVPEGCIIRQWNSGFKLGERLLRPARVQVSSGKAEPAADDAQADKE